MLGLIEGSTSPDSILPTVQSRAASQLKDCAFCCTASNIPTECLLLNSKMSSKLGMVHAVGLAVFKKRAQLLIPNRTSNVIC